MIFEVRSYTAKFTHFFHSVCVIDEHLFHDLSCCELFNHGLLQINALNVTCKWIETRRGEDPLLARLHSSESRRQTALCPLLARTPLQLASSIRSKSHVATHLGWCCLPCECESVKGPLVVARAQSAVRRKRARRGKQAAEQREQSQARGPHTADHSTRDYRCTGVRGAGAGASEDIPPGSALITDTIRHTSPTTYDIARRRSARPR